ncbi:toll-like receptor 4 [Ruditapes philippinarum]|uniref:toll-like receptor 4 n=1 Tax=Ruditapes philippinarum TaxID=129788 RepID=UPI00295B8A3E|nr:toll-like receptor 4 [Ruditapes philippinarum]
MFVLYVLRCTVMIVLLHISGGERLTHNGTCDICDCSRKYIVDCSNRNLTYIPRDIAYTTRVLNMASNFLQRLDEGVFENLTMLIRLDLHNTALKKENVSSKAFKGLVHLKFLNISQNDQFPLTNVSKQPELFEHLPSLEELRMYGTTGTYNIKYGYPDVKLSKMVNLKELWIDGLTKLPFGPAFRNMTNLRILRVAGDSIEPSWRSKEFCMIEELEDGLLDNLVNVTHLYIRKCFVNNIGKNVFRNMENLEYLDMSINKRLGFKQLFQSFCSLPMKTVSLILNEVTTRSSTMCGNAITTDMAKCIKDKSIRELQLNQNVIFYVEKDVFSIFPKTLQTVSIRKNEFHLGIYMFYVSDLTNLTSLDMSYQFFTQHTSIWHNANNKLALQDIYSYKFYEQGEQYLTTSIGENGDHKPPDNSNDSQSVDDYISNKSNILHHNNHHFSMNLNQNNNMQYETSLTNRQNKKKVCPQLNKDNYIPPGTVLVNIPPNLEYLDLSHSKIASPIFELFVNETNQLQNINASNSLLYCWDGPVHGLTKLETLDLSNNFCTNVSMSFFETLTNLRRLNISYNFLGSSFAKDRHGQIMANLTKLESLDFSFNLIYNIPSLFLKSQTELIDLKGNVNMMGEFNIDIRHMRKLRKLDLKANRIRTLSAKICGELEYISKIGSTNGSSDVKLFVDLRANPLECSCDNIKFIKWLSKYYVSNNSSLSVNVSFCLNYESHHKLENLTSQHEIENMVHYLEMQCRSFTSLIVGLSVTLALIINVILGMVVHKFRWKLQYWYYVVLKRKTVQGRGDYELIDEPRYKYDVFVASSDDQKEFVIDKLRPVFKQNELTAFIAVYHINFNDNLVNTISKAINGSKVVLFVFSDDWSTDHCMNIAVHMWQCDMIERKKRSVLGIFLNNMTGEDAVKTKEIYCSTFIDFPGGTDEEEHEAFWTDCVNHIKRQGDMQ